jgi:hypothetical protein
VIFDKTDVTRKPSLTRTPSLARGPVVYILRVNFALLDKNNERNTEPQNSTVIIVTT